MNLGSGSSAWGSFVRGVRGVDRWVGGLDGRRGQGGLKSGLSRRTLLLRFGFERLEAFGVRWAALRCRACWGYGQRRGGVACASLGREGVSRARDAVGNVRLDHLALTHDLTSMCLSLCLCVCVCVCVRVVELQRPVGKRRP